MDTVAERLRGDAERIEVPISPGLDDRIRASLVGISPAPGQASAAPSRSGLFWWASSLTGIAAALALIVISNLPGPVPVTVPAMTAADNAQLTLPAIAWRIEPAVLTSPLEEEIEDLQSDLKKAEQALKRDLDAVF